MNEVEEIDNSVPVDHALISVSDKAGLEMFVPALFELNPGLVIYSTGGTFGKIQEILEEDPNYANDDIAKHLVQVSDFTGQPETQGGLVKTLDFKIYLGLLTETYNPNHQADMERTGAVPIDMVVCNLYPFEQTIAKPGVNFEKARSNIDIGGPTMLRAAAKNCLRTFPVVDPEDYKKIAAHLMIHNGCSAFPLRFELAGKAFDHTAKYDRAIAEYMAGQKPEEAMKCYPTVHGEGGK